MKNKPPKLWSIDIISAEINITILVSHFGGLILKKKTWNLKKIDAQNIHHSKKKKKIQRHGLETWTNTFRKSQSGIVTEKRGTFSSRIFSPKCTL